MKVYLDSCLVIYLIEGADPWHQRVFDAIKNLPDATFCVSDLVRLECRVGAMRRSDIELLADYDRFFENATVLPVTSGAFDTATRLRAERQIKTPDAIHLGISLAHHCDEFWTNDTRLASITSEIAFRAFP